VTARWEQISLGFQHACAVSEDAELRCWGKPIGPKIASPHLVPDEFVVA